MAEPIPTSVAALAAHAVAVPAVTIAGLSLGLRADILLAGWCGAVAAISLLEAPPSGPDTSLSLLRASIRRIGVSIGSAMFAGYTSPLLLLIAGMPESIVLGVSFVAGAGAQKILPRLIDMLGRGRIKAEADPGSDK